MATKKNILLFGANSFVAKEFIRAYGEEYAIYPVYRQPGNGQLHLDFDRVGEVSDFVAKIDFAIDGIIFFQGINPSMSATAITEEHFLKMLRVNLVTPALLIAALRTKLAEGALVLMISSVAKRKGSYDPSYAAAKSGMTGLMHSLANAYPAQRFNIVSMGLVEGSPVYAGMTEDFRAKHASKMQNGTFIKAGNVNSVIDMLIKNTNINRTDIAVDGGYN
jgi:3-oxoacyl-[acyl-carrier protein] reductase